MNPADVNLIAETARDIAGYRQVKFEATPYSFQGDGFEGYEGVPLQSEDFLDWKFVRRLTIPNDECWLDIAISTFGMGGELIDNALCKFVGGRVVEIRATHPEGTIFWRTP